MGERKPLTLSEGFTLLELLIALAVFSVVAMMAYGGLRSVLDAKAQTARQAQRLNELQMAMLFIERDLSQVAPRGIRDVYGDPQPAILGGDKGLEFTRAGWRNPTHRVRSTLQRIGYQLDGDQLIRESWMVLDRAQDSKPYRAVLLGKVQAFKVRFMTAQRQWVDSWPAQSAPSPTLPNPQVVSQSPVAVEVTLELGDWGSITRIFVMGEGT